MKLLTKELEQKFPKLNATENKKPEDVEIIAKFFDPCGSWTWYATEGMREGNDFIFFGFVRGFENEFGNFGLKELESVKSRLGLGIERDLHFGKHMLSEAIEKRI
jgi:hypothetical protein